MRLQEVNRCLLPTVRRSRQQFTNAELGFVNNAPRDYQQSKSNKRSFSFLNKRSLFPTPLLEIEI